MLNVIGRRMLERPNAKITLTGTNSGAGAERNNTTLSKQRAETVRDYFVNTWGIESRRITVRSRNLPVDPSAVDDPRGQEENRRVEITSATEEIIAPIRRDEIAYSTSLDALLLKPSVDAPNGVERWLLQVSQGPRSLFSQSGTGSAPAASYRWDFEGEALVRSGEALKVELLVRDRRAQEEDVPVNIALNTLTLERKQEERIGDVRVNRIKLILFDYDKATVSKRNLDIIDEVTESITPTSRVAINGYTDALGDAEYNMGLSQQRAEAVKASFGAKLANVEVTTKGLGSTPLLFPNDTPEGRFYCRMVQVIIETPVQ
ncbi:MAG: OmpA family protein [Bacteroidia bacterium]|nr:OmpA family protein [Bacteroidia bacterium]